MQVEDRGGVGLDELQHGRPGDRRRRQRARSGWRRSTRTFRAGVPQLFVDVDREKVKSARRPARATSSARCRRTSARPTSTTSTSSAAPTRSACRPSQQFRREPDDIERLEVRNAQRRDGSAGHAASRSSESFGPADHHPLQPLSRRRRSRGEPAPGVSSGEALTLMEQIAAQQAARRRWATSGPAMSFQEKRVGGAGDLRLRAGRAAGVPGAGGAVRELARCRRR